MVKALGASEIIILTEQLSENDRKRIERECRDFILKALENQDDRFDVIINTVLDTKITKDLSKYLKEGGSTISTLPPKLQSDSCGIFSKYLLYWYIWLQYKLEVSY